MSYAGLDWMLDPPSEAQKRKLAALGVEGDPRTKGEASAWIEQALAEQGRSGGRRAPLAGAVPELWSGHDHRFPGAVEWLLCPNCGCGVRPGTTDHQGVEGDPCRDCGSASTVGTGWVCCFTRLLDDDQDNRGV